MYYTQNDILLNPEQGRWRELLRELSNEAIIEQINKNPNQQHVIAVCLEILIMQAEHCWGEEKQTDNLSLKRLRNFVEVARASIQDAELIRRTTVILNATSGESSRVHFLQWIGGRQRTLKTCVPFEQIC